MNSELETMSLDGLEPNCHRHVEMTQLAQLNFQYPSINWLTILNMLVLKVCKQEDALETQVLLCQTFQINSLLKKMIEDKAKKPSNKSLKMSKALNALVKLILT